MDGLQGNETYCTRTNKRKYDSSTVDKGYTTRINDKRFYPQKISPDDLTSFLKESTGDSSSSDSEETSEFWSISKSPLNKSLNNQVNCSRSMCKNSNALVVSPVKLKRKSDFCKVVPLSELKRNKSSGNAKLANGEDNKGSLDIKTTSECLINCNSLCNSHPIDKTNSLIKDNALKNKVTDSDSELSMTHFENIDSPKNTSNKRPKKMNRIDVSPKILKVVLNRCETDVLEKYGIYNGVLSPVKNNSLSKNLKEKIVRDEDLAYPLSLLDENSEMRNNFDMAKRNECIEETKENFCASDSGLNESETDRDETSKKNKAFVSHSIKTKRNNDSQHRSRNNTRLKSCKEINSSSDSEPSISCSDDSTHKSGNIRTTRFTRHQTNLRSNDIKHKPYSSRSRVFTKQINYKEVQTDSSSDDTCNDNKTIQTLKLSDSSSKLRTNKDKNKNSKETPSKLKKTVEAKAQCESNIRTSQRISSRRGSSLNEAPRDLKSSADQESASSPGRVSLRKRDGIKRPCYDDFETDFNIRRTPTNSPKSPAIRNKDEGDAVKVALEKSTPQSRRSSSRISNRESSKKETDSKENFCITPRSSLRHKHLSPLVDSVERISLRNRSDVKKKLGDEFKTDFGRHNSIVNSPKTPSHSLRKQVLESTTQSAKKKLIMGSESSDADEDFIPLRRTPRKKPISAEDKASPFKTLTKSVLTTPTKRTPMKTPNKSTPKHTNDPSTPYTPTTVRRVGQGFLTPVVEERSMKRHSISELEDLRLKLHVSTVPSSLPCRLGESKNIKSFISCKIKDKSGGCMYVSGVPGTGKTATVHAVIRTLQLEAIDKKISPFDFVEVNGLRLTEARQAYVRIWFSLSGSKVTSDQALHNLEKKFSGRPSRPTVLLVDELDYVCNRRQDVIYNILDWSTKRHSRLIVITIANTMDLPERTLKGRVTSRMGLTRLVFQPYSFQQLQEIVMNRIDDSFSFDPDAVQFVARKVAAVSGDARRALDICRRATELLEPNENQVTLEHVDKTLSQIYLSRRVQSIKHCSYMGQLLLRSLRDESLRTGVEESNVRDVFSHLCAICNLEGSWIPTVGQVLTLCHTLASSGLLSVEKGRRDILTKLTLNVSSDDIHYALSC